MNIITTIIAAIYILFLPGFVLSYAFFKKDEVDVIERFAFSFALSIAVVPLAVFYCNLIGIKITQLSVSIEILCIILAGVMILLIRKARMKSKQKKQITQ